MSQTGGLGHSLSRSVCGGEYSAAFVLLLCFQIKIQFPRAFSFGGVEKEKVYYKLKIIE